MNRGAIRLIPVWQPDRCEHVFFLRWVEIMNSLLMTALPVKVPLEWSTWPESQDFSTIQCVCVFSSHPFWTSSSLDVPAGVTQEEGHTGFLIQ